MKKNIKFIFSFDFNFRSDCVTTLKKTCEENFKKNSVKDVTIWKWKDQLISKTTSALLKMGFFGGKSENRFKDFTEQSEIIPPVP